ncbi:site-specific integrase [Mucilaginibacter lacusdianchii]|uniref:site-specific integrase n=1 Tax=Mucilaginibacter lacusdianchii TaxID=2684211 RepID=UPI00131BAA3A|nr:site-specific integrase [Mucilaginibacter sp. JXJ CY 39]
MKKMTYNIKIVLREDKIKADNTIPIYYSVRVGLTTSRIPSGKSILQKDWQVKDNCPKSNSKANQLLAAFLNQKMSEWKLYMLEHEMMGKPITLNMAKAYFKNGGKITFYDFCKSTVELWEERIKESTLKTYKSTINVLKAFSPKANFGDLDHTFVLKFEAYLDKVRGNTTGGKFTRHKCLKSLCNEAIKQGHMSADQHPYRYFKIKAAKGERNFLSIKELQQVVNAELPENELMLQKVRDLFLFSCYTGLRYSDCQNLTWQSIKADAASIKFKAQKTSKETIIPIIESAQKLLDQYGKHSIKASKASILPQIANQVVNRNLKDLMKLAGINKTISFHCGRHTFASNLIEAGVNLIYVQKLLGHSRIADTQIYAQGLESNLFDSMHNLEKMYKQAI